LLFSSGGRRAAVSFSCLRERNSKAFVSHRKGGREEGRKGRKIKIGANEDQTKKSKKTPKTQKRKK